MSDSQDQKKKDGENVNKKNHAMHENEHQIERGREAKAHNPTTEVGEVTSSHSMHEHGLQNKEVNKDNRKAVNIHSDDKNERHTHVPKKEQMEHDLASEKEKQRS